MLHDGVEEDGGGPSHGIVTIPNVVTSLRLAALPVFIVLALRSDHRVAAAALLAGIGVTDWVDGQLARRLGQVSRLGQLLDPLADRLVLVAAATTMVAIGAVPVVVAVVTLAREVLVVAGGTLAMAARGARRLDVSLVGKAGTFALLFAFPLFLVGHSTAGWHHGAEILAWCWAVPGAILAWVAAARYVPAARAALAPPEPVTASGPGRGGGGRS